MLRGPDESSARLDIDAKFFWTQQTGDLHEPFPTQDFTSFESFLEAHCPIKEAKETIFHNSPLAIKCDIEEAKTQNATPIIKAHPESHP